MKLIAMDSVLAEGKEVELIQLLHIKAQQRPPVITVMNPLVS
jgi:hypothetical protein